MTRATPGQRGEDAPEPFRWTRSISSGAFFTVFEVVRDDDSSAAGERAVCKRLTSRGRENAEARESLVREGAIGDRIARTGSRAVAEVLARGDDAAGPFLVTRFVVGTTLRAVPPSVVDRDFVVRAFAALDDVHGAGVVHGDVHLDNIIVADDGRVVLLDFGLASAPPSSAFRGSVLYAAPEAARGEPVDASSDRFSLAAALLHLASGVAPRSGANAAALLHEAGAVPLDAWLAALPPEVAHLAEELGPFLRFDQVARPAARLADSA